jgi:hypothetical protein
MASGNATAANTPTTPTAANATSPLSTISLTASPAAMTLLDGGITDKEADAVNAQSSNSGSNQTVLLASIIGGVVIVVVGLVVFAVLRRTRLQLQHYPNTMEMSSASKAQLPLSSSPLQDDTSNTNTGSNERDSAPENSHARLAQSSDGRKVTRRGSPTEKVDSTESSPDDSISDVTRTWTASSITPVSVEHAINAKQIGDYAAGAAAVANLEYKDQARTVVAVHTGSSTPKTTMPVSPTETRHDNDNRPIVDPKEMSDDRAVEGLAFKDQARTVVALPTMSSTPDSHNGPATIEPTSNVQAPTPPPPLPPPVAVAVAASASTATSTPIAQATLMNEVALNAGNMSASAGEPLSDGGGITEQKRPTIDP